MAKPGVAAPPRKIAQVMTVGVGFPLKGYVHVSIMPVAILCKAYQPLCDIQDIEWHEQQFALLRGVDALMVDDASVNP